MKCYSCDSEMRSERRKYHYTECGLDNVYLDNVRVFVCDKCNEEEVSLPCVPDLHMLLGKIIVSQKQPLDGKEVRFLRKNAGLSATKLAKILGVSLETISRWENDKIKIKSSSDRLIRMVYCAIMDVPSHELKNLVQNNFEEIAGNKMADFLHTIQIDQLFNENGMCMMA